MKRYALFAGFDYYPRGGAKDFVAFGKSVEECRLEYLSPLRFIDNGSGSKEPWGWGQIVELSTMAVVLWAEGRKWTFEEPL